MKPRVFVGSSSEGLVVAKAVCFQLRRETEPTLWNQDVFLPGNYALEALEEQITSHSFAVLVASPDDELIKRGKLYPAMRDNLLLEFGLFVGALGRKHAFFICPSTPKVAIPSDLTGVIPATYDASRIRTKASRIPKKIAHSDKALRQAVKVACRQVLKEIKKQWRIMRRHKVEEVRKLKQSEKYRAAEKFIKVSGRLFTKTQREAFTNLSDEKTFKKIKATTVQEINVIAEGLTAEAKLLGLEYLLEEVTAATTAAVRDFPHLSTARLEKKEIGIRRKMIKREMEQIAVAKIALQRTDNRVEDGDAAERDIKDMDQRELCALEEEALESMNKKRDDVQAAIMKEVKGYLENRYERWWNKHWPRLEQASEKINRALANVLLELGRTGVRTEDLIRR